MNSDVVYDKGFFDSHRIGSAQSARAILPIVFEYIAPKSVIDVGCGSGDWLSVALELGVHSVLGVDGDYVTEDALSIDSSQFVRSDLTRPLEIERRFDLAICVEVIEHLSNLSETTLIESLVKAADVIVFSGAIPQQGGTHHINERWPWHWARLFGRHGWGTFDVLRPRIWHDRTIEWWYRQNIFLVVKEDVAANMGDLASAPRPTRDSLTLVQGNVLERLAGDSVGVGAAARLFARSVKRRLSIRRNSGK